MTLSKYSQVEGAARLPLPLTLSSPSPLSLSSAPFQEPVRAGAFDGDSVTIYDATDKILAIVPAETEAEAECRAAYFTAYINLCSGLPLEEVRAGYYAVHNIHHEEAYLSDHESEEWLDNGLLDSEREALHRQEVEEPDDIDEWPIFAANQGEEGGQADE